MLGGRGGGKLSRTVYLAPHLSIHYENKPRLYTAIFHVCKNDNFQMKNCNIFHIFAPNIDCGYTLEPSQYGGSNK